MMGGVGDSIVRNRLMLAMMRETGCISYLGVFWVFLGVFLDILDIGYVSTFA